MKQETRHNLNITHMQPTLHTTIDWSTICAIWGLVIAFLGAVSTGIAYNYRFKLKRLEYDKQQNEDFIRHVVTVTMEGVLKDVRKDIDQLFKYRDEDKKHWDERFDKVITAIKK